MARPEPVLTYEDYLHFPDEQRWELLDGEAYMSPAPKTRHQVIVKRLLVLIDNHLSRHGGGDVHVAPVDVVLTDTNVVQPDIVFVSEDRKQIITEDNVRGAPDWVIEVLSDPHRDRELKRQIYARAGIPEYWIVDPGAETVETYRLEGDRYPDPEVHAPPGPLAPRRLPTLSIDLERLFQSD